MPCFEINLVSVVFHAENVALLKRAAVTLQWRFEQKCNGDIIVNAIKIANGKAIGSSQDAINKLKRAYSVECVKEAAKANKWALKEVKKNEFVANKTSW